MAEEWHAPYEKLSRRTITVHQAIRSLMEELEAVDWYRQRADDCEDAQLQAVLLHHAREEIEHASMLLEWLRRNDGDFARQLGLYLFGEGEITTIEDRATAGGPVPADPPPNGPPPNTPSRALRFTVGPMKEAPPWTR